MTPIHRGDEHCDFCGISLDGQPLIDAKTKSGPWATMCNECADKEGVRFGLGFGQKYDTDGVKIKG